jgi:serine/threonine-protein kinase
MHAMSDTVVVRPGVEPEPSRDGTATIVDRGRVASGSRDGLGADAPTRGGDARPAAKSTTLRHFEVIGRGGMGLVYRSEQVELGRPVAFKLLPDGATEAQRERFLREARITAQLDHPNIVPVHLLELPDDRGTVGYAMKLVEGKTLRTLLAEAADAAEAGTPIDDAHAPTRLLEHFVKICEAVAFAHARGVIHRDLKPANFMVGAFGEVYVMDWGVARALGMSDPDEAPSTRRSGEVAARLAALSSDVTQVGDVIGSPGYMAPEQALGQPELVDARSDQYALGLTLFEIVTLRRAVRAANTAEAYLMAARGEKAPLEPAVPGVRIPPELAAIVAKATAVEARARYGSVAEFAEDVRRYLRGDAVVALPEGPLARLLRTLARHRRATFAATIVALSLGALAGIYGLYRDARADLASERRAERWRTLSFEVAAQAHRIDVELRHIEEALEGLRVAAEWALVGPDPGTSAPPLFRVADFADPARRPADFTKDTAYRWPVSVEHPVVGLSPGTAWEAVEPKVRKLAPLREHLRAMIVAASGREPWTLTRDETNRVLRGRSSPIDYAYVDLPEGVHYVFPGIDALPPDYDVRTASFYTMSERKHGRRWGRPYVDSTTDAQGDDLVLPCTQGLWSPQGEFLGVAGVEITVTKMVETVLTLPGREVLRASLLDGEGRKVIDSGDAGRRFRASGKDEGIELAPFDVPEVVREVVARREGLVVLPDRVAVYARVPALDWTYVVELRDDPPAGD